VARGATTVVLSRGMNQRLRVRPDTCRYLEQRSIMVHVAETREGAMLETCGSAGKGCTFPVTVSSLRQ
jgi:hypothetical protein